MAARPADESSPRSPDPNATRSRWSSPERPVRTDGSGQSRRRASVTIADRWVLQGVERLDHDLRQTWTAGKPRRNRRRIAVARRGVTGQHSAGVLSVDEERGFGEDLGMLCEPGAALRARVVMTGGAEEGVSVRRRCDCGIFARYSARPTMVTLSVHPSSPAASPKSSPGTTE